MVGNRFRPKDLAPKKAFSSQAPGWPSIHGSPINGLRCPNLGQRKHLVSYKMFRGGLHHIPPEGSKPHWPTSDDDDANDDSSGGASSGGGASNGGANSGDDGARRDPCCAFHWRSQSLSRQCKTRRPTIGLVCISWDGGNESSRGIHNPSSPVHFQFLTNCKSLIPLGLFQKATGVCRQKEIGCREDSQRVSIGPSNPGPPAATKPSLVPWSFGLTQNA